MSSLTPSPSTSNPSHSTTSAATNDSLSGPKEAGIIAGAVVGGLLLVCLIVAIIVPAQRKRGRNNLKKPRQVYGAKSEVAASASASDEDDVGAAENGSGPGPEVTENSRGTSDSTLLMPLVRESDQKASYPSNTYPSPTRDNPRSFSPNSSPMRRMLTVSSVMSHESTYSQASASTRMHRDLAERHTSSPPPPVPSLPAQLQLPPIPQTEPIGELLKARAAAAGPSSWNANESTESASFSPTSIYSPASPSTNFNPSRQLSRGPSTRARTPDQRPHNTLTRSSRGTPARSRTVLSKPPMEPVIEFDASSLQSPSVNNNGIERWSSAADPGGSHPRPVVLDRFPNPHPDLGADRPLTPSAASQGLGRGLSLLTTAFRKSLSASSDATHGSGSSYASQHTNGNANTLHHYPSVASMGTSVASGTGTGTGSFYTAMSDVGNDSQSTGNRNSGLGMLASNILRKKMGSQNSLSTYPSIPSLPSTSRPPRSNPPVPPVPPLPPTSKHMPPLPKMLDTISGLNGSSGSKPSPTSRAKAHLRTPAAHRVRADPHAQPAITRSGLSTHGVIDIAEG